ncbi:MAG: hypothetical protein C0417_05280 [Chlorobiaceae bacterium]|nr:hypothetical protein [Chlorobiaceae bacterium]
MDISGVKNIKKWIFLALIFQNIILAGTSTKNIVASHTSESISIDGLLTEQSWSTAIQVSGFMQFDPDEGAAATEQTSVRVLYDDDALYIGVICYDANPEMIVHQLTRRDRSVQADRFSVMIDSYHDYNTAFLFSGSVSGVKSDGVLSHDGLVYDVQWDAVWDFAANVSSDAWSAEFRIPFSALRFSSQDTEYVWGVNFRRYIARKKETDEWVMVPRSEVPPGTISSVSKMGKLSGIADIHPPLHIELLPYHVSKGSFLTQPSPLSLQKDYDINFGIDLKYGITNNFTLDAAINPDFGQVEVDKKVLNLTVFETEYPEKRPFFLEGSQIFSFGNGFDNKPLPLLYSRRIGKYPSGNNTLSPDSGYIYNKPEVTTILGAAKFSGRTDDGLVIGALTAVTDQEQAILEDVQGKKFSSIIVEPRASYNVVRLRKDLWDCASTGSFGLMATSSSKEKQSPSYTGGVDWNLRFSEGVYGIDGYLAGSNSKYSSDKNVSGSIGKVVVGKLRGENWFAFTGYDFATKYFNIDDLGFFSKPREHGGYFQLSYKNDKTEAPLWRYVFTAQSNYRWNWNGINTIKEIEIEPVFEFRNFWRLTLDYYHEMSAYDDENRGIIGLYKKPPGNKIFGILQTDSRKPISVALNSGYMKYNNGSQTIQSVVEATIRPFSWIEFVPGFTFMKTKKEEAWVVGAYSGGHNLFGDRDVDYFDLSLKGTVTFTPNVSFQFFNQIMLAKWKYVNLKTLIAPDQLALLPIDQQYSPEYFMKVFNANIVFRWEYLPGSTFFLVWTQGRQGYGGLYDQSVGRDFHDVFRLPMDNVILAKISYWWSF